MTPLTHIIYGAAYSVIGVVVGLGLLVARPAADPVVAVLGGAVVILACGLIHEVIARVTWTRRKLEQIQRLRRAIDDLTVVADQLRGDFVDLRSTVDHRSPVDRASPTVAAGPELAASTGAPGESGSEADLRRNLTGRLVRPAPAAHRGASGAGGPAGAAGRVALDVIREALQNDRIDLFLQAIVALPARKHRYYEVFSRLRAADGRHLMPDQYLEIAERENLIATIDSVLLVRCIQMIRETERRQHPVGFFANISAGTVGDSVFMGQFVQYIGQHPELASKLMFELGQLDLAAGGDGLLARLEPLSRLGFRFSVDQVRDLDLDVARLARREFRFIKVEAGLLLDPTVRKSVAELRRRLEGYPVALIAEKIETEDQLTELLAMNIDLGQGYLFGEPRLSKKIG